MTTVAQKYYFCPALKMVFNSATFLIFFFVFWLVYWRVSSLGRVRLRNLLLLTGSFLFYGWWDWRFLLLLVASAGVDFFSAQMIEKHAAKAKFFLSLSIAVNLGILAFFKYFNFFTDSLHHVFSFFGWYFPQHTLNIILPVGVSFYTFQALSYTIDVYRKKLAATRDIVEYFAFISFFPQLVAGPIERASQFLPQFREQKQFSYGESVSGLRLMLWGFFKKIVIADNFGVLTDAAFSANQVSGWLTIFGTVCFAMQIYADFSGYSDIAIGTARMLGFDLMTNFRTPYFSRTFSEFWTRWHISLSSWFRDYVYIPLGGNRTTAAKVARNILITFLLSGLWHGATWAFVIWGGAHGLLLVLEKRFEPVRWKQFYRIFVMATVVLLWLPFRAISLKKLQELSSSLFDVNNYSTVTVKAIICDFSLARMMTLLGITALFLLVERSMCLENFNDWIGRRQRWQRIGCYYLLILAILLAGNFSVKPSFIYFQF